MKKKESANVSAAHARLTRSVEKASEKLKSKGDQSETLMKAFKDREASLNDAIESFLVSEYGHNGDPPMIKIEKDELIQRVRKTKKRIEDGKKETEPDEEDEDEPILTKKEILMSTEDMKYMSSG